MEAITQTTHRKALEEWQRFIRTESQVLRVWDAQMGAELATLSGHSFWVLDCAFSPDGGRIVSASSDATLKIWNAETGARVANLSRHVVKVTACAFSPDGSRIVSASWDETLKLWDAETGAELATVAGRQFAFSPDGRYILSVPKESLDLWDAHNGVDTTTLGRHTKIITACAFCPDGRRIDLAFSDGILHIWDTETRAEVATLTDYELGSEVTTIAWSPDGSRVFAGSHLVAVLLLRVENVSVMGLAASAWCPPSSRWPWRRALSNAAVGCPACGEWSAVEREQIDSDPGGSSLAGIAGHCCCCSRSY